MLKSFTLVVALSGCARPDTNQPEDAEPVDQAEDLRQAFHANLADFDARTSARAGWPSATDCDGTLWAGEACYAGASTNILLAEYAPGEIHRRPAPSCWTKEAGDQGSKSTVSRDMLTGYLACLWSKGDLAGLQRLADYGEGNEWVMGKPASEPATWLSPNLAGLLGRMIYALSNGTDDRYPRLIPKEYPKVQADYEQHIQAAGITLQGAVEAELRRRGLQEASLLDVNDQMLERLRELAGGVPENAFFQAALGVYTGDLVEAVRLLLDPGTPRPGYVRGDSPDDFARAHWLMTARIVLSRFERGEQ